MPKRKEENTDILGTLKSIATSTVDNYVKGVVDDIRDLVEYIGERALQVIYASALLVVGLLFLCIAVVMLISQYLGLSLGWSLTIMGLILVLAGIMIKNKAMNDIDRKIKRRRR